MTDNNNESADAEDTLTAPYTDNTSKTFTTKQEKGSDDKTGLVAPIVHNLLLAPTLKRRKENQLEREKKTTTNNPIVAKAVAGKERDRKDGPDDSNDSFPVKLYRMVQWTTLEFPRVCSWSQDGRCIVIDSKNVTLLPILRRYFNHSHQLHNYLHSYGFTLAKNVRGQKVYYHPNFHRDIKDPYTLEKLIPILPGKSRREQLDRKRARAAQAEAKAEAIVDTHGAGKKRDRKELEELILDRKALEGDYDFVRDYIQTRQQLELEVTSEQLELELDPKANEKELEELILDRKARHQFVLDRKARQQLELEAKCEQQELDPKNKAKERRTSPTTVVTIGESGGLSSSKQLELDPKAKEKEQRTSSPTTVATTGESGRLGSSNDVLSLNIGGVKIVKVLRKTLTCVPESSLAFWFSGRMDHTRDKDGTFFINDDPISFESVLRHLESILSKGDLLVPSLPSMYGKTWEDAFYRKIERYGLTKSMYPVEWREHILSSKNENDLSIAVLHPKYDSNHRSIQSFEVKLGAIRGLHNYVGWVGDSSASEEEASVRPTKRRQGETTNSVGREQEGGFVSIFLCFNVLKGDQHDVCLAIRTETTEKVVVVASWASLEALFYPSEVPKEIVVRSENYGRAWHINGTRLELNIQDLQDFDAFMNIHAGDLLPFHRVRGSIELSSFKYKI